MHYFNYLAASHQSPIAKQKERKKEQKEGIERKEKQRQLCKERSTIDQLIENVRIRVSLKDTVQDETF